MSTQKGPAVITQKGPTQIKRWPFEAIVYQARQQSYRGHGKYFSLCDQQFMLRVLGDSQIRKWVDKNIALAELREEGWTITGPYPKQFPTKKKPRERFYGYGLSRVVQ
jgi:hypothetical protein